MLARHLIFLLLSSLRLLITITENFNFAKGSQTLHPNYWGPSRSSAWQRMLAINSQGASIPRVLWWTSRRNHSRRTTYGLRTSCRFHRALSNGIFSAFKPSLNSIQNYLADTPHFRFIVAMSYVASFGASFVSVLMRSSSALRTPK